MSSHHSDTEEEKEGEVFIHIQEKYESRVKRARDELEQLQFDYQRKKRMIEDRINNLNRFVEAASVANKLLSD